MEALAPHPAQAPEALQSDVLGALAGDRAAYARLVYRHRNLVSSIALAIVRDVPASEDVAQEVFLDAWSALSRLRNPTSFLPWLRQLARNHAHTFLRRRRSAPATPVQDELLAAAADPRPGALEALTSREERELIVQAIEALPDETREVVLLYYREGQSAAQVAALLGLREDAVKKRLSRAREKLREAMAERFGEALDRSKPGSAFTAAVIAALPQAGTAVATGVGLKAAAKTLGGKLWPLLGGAGLGAASGIAGALLGAHLASKGAIDDKERRAFWRMGLINSGGVLICAGAFVVEKALEAPQWTWWAAYLALVGEIFWATQVWGPRIIERRQAADLLRDPEGAKRRYRRGRIFGFLGWLGGSLGGAWGLWAGWHQ